jgi:hypothetical protein
MPINVAARQLLDDFDDAHRSIESVFAGLERTRLPRPHEGRTKRAFVRDDAGIDQAPPYLRRTGARRDLYETLGLGETLVRLLNPLHHVERKRRGATDHESDDDKERKEKLLHDRLSR